MRAYKAYFAKTIKGNTSLKEKMSGKLSDKEHITMLEEELKRKDQIIENLREENVVLLRMSVKRAEEHHDVKDMVHQINEEKK